MHDIILRRLTAHLLRRRGANLMRRYIALADLFNGFDALEEALPHTARYRRRARACARLARRFRRSHAS